VNLEDAWSQLRRLSVEEREWLREGAVRLLAPLIASDGSLVGMIALGAKKSEAPFTKEDRLLLSAIAASGALTIENRLMRTPQPQVEGERAGASTLAPVAAPSFSDTAAAAECSGCRSVFPAGSGQCQVCGGKLTSAPVPYLLAQKFQMQKRVGSGGMGIVYRATDTKLNRPVALKILPPEFALHHKARARFIREARAASALDHPQIGTIYEIGEWNQQLFIAMAYYEGQTLNERIEKALLPFPEIEKILSGLASGLVFAHAAGIIHRDLKPANVMLTYSGQLKILDFGLAKLVWPEEEGETALTEAGALVGTVAYMSPEQVKHLEVDSRTDLWSLGVIAYEMVTGTSPFHAGTKVATIARILTEQPRPLGQMREGVPPRLRLLVEQLLQKDRAARIRSAGDVLKALA